MLKAGPAACWLWVCGLAYCQRHSTDGHIPAEALAWLGVVSPQKMTAALVAAGLWHRTDNGWRVHDYLDWNESSESRRKKTTEKNERQQRWRDSRRDVDSSTTTHVDASTSRLGDAAPTPPPTPTPPPQPTPLPQPPPIEGEGNAAPAALRIPSGRPGSPLRWGLDHARCVAGFCDWMCLPAEDFGRFAGRLGVDGEAKALAWATAVRASGVVPTGKPWAFWNAQFDAAHGSPTSGAGGFSAADWAAHAPGGAIDKKLGLS